MNCSEFERSLDDLVESHGDRLTLEAERHRADCPACAALWQEHHRLEAAVRAWRGQTPAIDLTSRVLAELQPVAPRRFRSSRGLVLAAGLTAAAAATLLLAVWPGWPMKPGPVAVAVAPDEMLPGGDSGGVDLTESMVELWQEVKESTPALPEPVRPRLPQVEDVWPLLVSQEETAVPSEPAPPTESAVRTPLSTVVRQRVTSAFGFLGQTLPVEPRG